MKQLATNLCLATAVCTIIVASVALGAPSLAAVAAASITTIVLVVFGIRTKPIRPDGTSSWKLIYSLTVRESISRWT